MRCSRLQRFEGCHQSSPRHFRPLQGCRRRHRSLQCAHDALLPLETAVSTQPAAENCIAAGAGGSNRKGREKAVSGRHVAPSLQVGVASQQGCSCSPMPAEVAGLGLLLPHEGLLIQQQLPQQHAVMTSAGPATLPSVFATHQQAADMPTATQQQRAAIACETQWQLQHEQPQQQQLLQHQAPPHRKAAGARRLKQRLPAVPLRYPAPGRGQGLSQAAAMAKHIRGGRHLLLPAGSGMQLARGLSALATARTLLLSQSSTTGLAFQPSYGTQHQQHQQQASTTAAAPDGVASSSSSSSIVMLVTGLPEAQLRCFDQQPLIASRHGPPSKLAAAAFARLCRQGFTSIRAAGPDATRTALAAAADARRKLLGCGLDLAVVPATLFVELELGEASCLTGPEGQQALPLPQQQQQFGEEFGCYDGGCGDDETALVRLTVLHCVRCEPQQPWKLLPWPVPAAQQPAVQWLRQQQQQQQEEAYDEQQHHQQQQQPADWRPGLSHPMLELQAREQQWGAQPVLQPAALQVVAAGLGSCGSSPGWLHSPDGPDASSGSSVAADPDPSARPVHVARTARAAGQRPSGALLLQKQNKSKRQLVAAAGGSHTST